MGVFMFFPEFLQVLALGHPSGWAVASSSFRFPIGPNHGFNMMGAGP